MSVGIALAAAFATVLLGRLMFSRWFNHVAVYGVVWGFTLALFNTGFIRYYPIDTETWLIVAAGWIAFLLGSGTVVAMRFALSGEHTLTGTSGDDIMQIDPTVLKKTLWTINIVAIIFSMYTIYLVSRFLGGVGNIVALGNLLYSTRVHSGIPGAIPYLASLASLGCLLGGYYTSAIGKLKAVAVIPVVAAIVNSIANMSRATIIMAAILFVSGFFLGKRDTDSRSASRIGSVIKKGIAVLVVLALIVGAMEFIRANRGMKESFEGTTASLQKLRSGPGFITPSIIFYLTGEYGVLNQYLKQDVEHYEVGHYSLAPVLRVLSKFGFDTYVEQHSVFYRTPISANPGSYLRELHADYGVPGIVIFPFVLGIIASMFWFRTTRSVTMTNLVVMGHIYVGVGMSIFTFAPRMGDWIGSLIFGLIVSLLTTGNLFADVHLHRGRLQEIA